jgi:DNA-directed RNA polymerase specialized sigma24 family protein
MTGQISRSIDTIDEVYQSLTEDVLESIDTYAELKVCLYTTARKFNADIWNADTAKLQNAALERTGGESSKDAEDLDEPAANKTHRQLDKALRGLSGAEREAVLLRCRAHFDFSELSEIMSISEHEAEGRFNSGVKKVAQEVGGGTDLEARIFRAPAHPLPLRSSQATMNLSMVMQGIKAKPVRLWSPVRIGMLILIAALVGGYLFFPEFLTTLFHTITSGGESGEALDDDAP